MGTTLTQLSHTLFPSKVTVQSISMRGTGEGERLNAIKLKWLKEKVFAAPPVVFKVARPHTNPPLVSQALGDSQTCDEITCL